MSEHINSMEEIEEISRKFWEAAVNLRVAQLKEEHPQLTKEQLAAQAYKDIPEAYTSYVERQRARQQGK